MDKINFDVRQNIYESSARHTSAQKLTTLYINRFKVAKQYFWPATGREPQVCYILGRTEKNGIGGMKTMASVLSLMQRLRLSHTEPRLSVMIRNWQCQRISSQTRDLDKSAIVIRLSLFSTNCHFLVWLPLSWAYRAQEMVYRPLRLGSGVWKSKVNYWYPETECCDDHEAGHEWSDNVCLEMGDVTRYCYDIHCCPVTERNSSPSAGSRHDLPA